MSAASFKNYPASVYYCHDAAGSVIYIGCSMDVGRRMVGHKATSEWFADVDRVESIEYPTRAEAEAAEKAAIRLHRPPRNRKDNGPDGLSSNEVLAAIPGLTYRQIDYWCRKGYISPGTLDADGSGSRRVFSPEQVDNIRRLFNARRWAA